MHGGIVGLFVGAFAPGLVAAQEIATTEEALAGVVAKARAASGIAKLAATGRDLVVAGDAEVAGLKGRWTLRLAADGRFASSFDSELSRRTGFDGEITWSVDPSGLPTRSWFAEREHELIDVATSFGIWCLEGGPLAVLASEPGGSDATTIVRMRAKNGEIEAELELDGVTSLPIGLRYPSPASVETWRWTGWHEVEGGLLVAREHAVDDDGQVSTYRIDSARLVAPDPAAFSMPTARPDDASFDPAAPSRLEGHATRTRHLVVKPRLDGEEVGWFIFDSGAGAACIDPGVADQLGMPKLGTLLVGGAGAGRVESSFRSARELALGPVTMERPLFIELEMDALGAALGEELSGIVGYDLLQRVVATVDSKAGAIDLHDPSSFARDGVVWRELVLAGNHPHVECTFANEGVEEALFRLDTGAGGLSVVFHAPFVEELSLLDGRKTSPIAGFGGVGGQSKVRLGRLDWFEIGDLTIDGPQALFCQDESGAFADPWTAGTVGSQFLDRFDVIFDYPHGRVGFVARDSPVPGEERAAER